MRALVLWLEANETLLWLAGVGSLVTFLASLVAIPWLVVRMPADYFLDAKRPMIPFLGEHRALRLLALCLKNLLGGLCVLAGVAMLVLPGQGILAILIGLSLMNFPGKRRLELFLVRQWPVLRGINWIRARAGRPPLRLPAPTVPRPDP